MPRIQAYNESFVPAGQKHEALPTAVLWHDAMQGRSKENIVSSFYQYFLSIRDVEYLTLWLDNCSAQNKNWCLYTFFVYILNSDETNLRKLTVRYFEPGHTFMAADSFHHHIESSLKRKGKIYDFNDYVEAVRKSTKATKIIEMTLEKFHKWEDHASQYKLKKTNPRAYLSDMVEVIFEKGRRTLTYKNSFNEDGLELNFLNSKSQKQGIEKPKEVDNPKGIPKTKKVEILAKITNNLPKTRLSFWQDLPETDDLETSDDNHY